ncbi:Signal transduction histidine kinase [Agromyces sp. CF514]|uniref:sensor histidine kinase n=1 Tax=Agromyces sp. CF514 TaxID=1881031 RepID=UPI0008E0A5F1|nr:sensor histidine kinase [Agromyces sp. CF514]SFR78846.1 Signal transduction histidine kinase [Agromyces sp. CF514]
MTASAAPAPLPLLDFGRVSPSALRPVFVTLRFGLHVLVVGLALFVMIRALLADGANEVPVTILTIAFLACYGAGVATAHRNLPQWARVLWLTALLALWAAMSALTPDAAFLAFPLFFLELHVLAAPLAVPLVIVTFGLSVWGTATHLGFEVGTILGPLISAGVAIVIGLGYRAMAQETKDRQALILDLIATREELATASREAGTLAERERIAREIHDTVAQGLSSIQMLLHAAERDVADERTLEKLRLARETASENLAETRRFIRELSPPSLDEQTLPSALRRLAAAVDEQAAQAGSATRVSFATSGDPVTLPMSIDATLLRIAQGALANVLRHARATRAELTLSYLGDEIALDVVDDGIGFDPAAIANEPGSELRFGLRAMRERAEREGGSIEVESHHGDGTAVSVRIPVVTA